MLQNPLLGIEQQKITKEIDGVYQHRGEGKKHVLKIVGIDLHMINVGKFVNKSEVPFFYGKNNSYVDIVN